MNKIKVFLLSHVFKDTYKHYCSLIDDFNQQLEANTNKDLYIQELKNQYQRERSTQEELFRKYSECNEIINILRKENADLIEKLSKHKDELEKKTEQIKQLMEEQIKDKDLNEHNVKLMLEYKKTIQLLMDYLAGKAHNNLSCMKQYQYRDLHYILEIQEDNSSELFQLIASDVFQYNIENIKRKPKIKVAFLTSQASIWACEPIYNRLASDNRYEAFIIVTPFEYGSDHNTVTETYNATCAFFEEKYYNYRKAYDVVNNKYLDMTELGSPDIVFHQTPHTTYLHSNYQIESFNLNVLNIYIPYGIMIVNGHDIQFNQKFHHLCWKIFCETPLHQKMMHQYSLIQDSNVECSGYVKMDPFLNCSEPIIDSNKIWKLPPMNKSIDETIKIIWAPHHALVDHPFAFGTFHKNYKFFYELAKKYPQISWIVKPHPLLKNDSIHFGLFRNSDEYDMYMNKWDELPNARTIHEGSYIDIFKTSDAMILDSVSFLAEYLYVQKPSLFLTKTCDSFNEFGDLVKDCHYQVDGEDFDGIEAFITNVLISKKDTMKDTRMGFYNKYLNYLELNKGLLASDYIYSYFCNVFSTNE